jgi:glycosyltransferase involved in cell wall biosynthesis
MMQKRLMMITHDLDIGGLQQVIVNICKTIDRRLFDVSVLCLRGLGSFVPEVERMGIKVFSLPQNIKGVDYFSFLKIARILKQQKIQVIHSHNTQPFIEGTIGGLIAGVNTIIHTDHARDFPDKKRYMLAEWVMSHFVYKVVGVSEHTSQNLMKYEKISPRKILTIPNGIDGSKYSLSINKTVLREELALPKIGPIIGLGVRLTDQKGITYLLQAMPAVIKAFPDVTLLIAGDGPLEGALREETISLHIDDHVRFIGPRLDMPRILKLLDLYVLPSIWEGLPMVLLEALAAGCPILATDVGGNATAITNGFNGSLVSALDPQILSLEIINLLSNPALRNEYARHGLERFQREFNAEIMTRKYEQLYLRTT